MKNKQIVFSDIDGTLLTSTLEISPDTVAAIRALAQRGVPFVIVSARGPMAIAPLLAKYDLVCPEICYSGALLRDEHGKVLYHKPLGKATAKAVIDYLRTLPYDTSTCVYSPDQWISPDRNDPRVQSEERIVEAQSVQGTVDDITDDVSKLLVVTSKADLDGVEAAVKQAFPYCTVVRSGSFLLEVMAGGVNKAEGVRLYCQLTGASPADCIAFGDHYNDVEMLRVVGRGYLMGNAPKELLATLPLHTDDNNHDGIPHALRKEGIV